MPNQACKTAGTAITSEPRALVRRPMMLYQENAAVRLLGSTAWARIAISSDKNAVRSPPVDVVIAMSEIRTSPVTLDAKGYSKPPMPMRTAMTNSMRFLPMVSPRQLAMALESVPPPIIALNTSPACSTLKSNMLR